MTVPAVSVAVYQLTLRVRAAAAALSRRTSTGLPAYQLLSVRVPPSLSVTVAVYTPPCGLRRSPSMPR